MGGGGGSSVEDEGRLSGNIAYEEWLVSDIMDLVDTMNLGVIIKFMDLNDYSGII